MAKLSIVVPVYNEAKALTFFHDEIMQVTNLLPYHVDLIYVNDGSSDETSELLRTLTSQRNVQLNVLEFGRNYGKEMAILAGLDNADGDAVVVMDSDLQHPPSLIPELLATWQHGFEIVHCVRTGYDEESKLRNFFSVSFQKLLNRLSGINSERHLTDFCLLDRVVVNEIVRFRERRRLFRVLLLLTGFKRKVVPFIAPNRAAGESKFNLFRLVQLTVDSITSMSSVPLYLSFYIGLIMFFISFAEALYAIFVKLFTVDPLPGWASTVGWLSFFAGVQLMITGLLGLYTARIFDEVKGRPLYIISRNYVKKEVQEPLEDYV